MPRILYVPSPTSWAFAFGEGDLPQTFTLPAGADAGEVIFTASDGGGSPPDPEGVIGTVVIDGGAPIDTACLTVGSESIPIPALSTTVTVSVAKGCNAGPDPTIVEVSGVNT